MKEKFVAKVPESHIHHPPQLSARMQWHSSYNVACWLRLQQPRPCRFSLTIKYMDQEGVTKSVTVDACNHELGASLLLSGLANIQAVGRITDMGVYIETSDNPPPYVVDELFVQSTEKTAAKAPKLISAV